MADPDPATNAAERALTERYGLMSLVTGVPMEVARIVVDAARPLIEAEATARERQRIRSLAIEWLARDHDCTLCCDNALARFADRLDGLPAAAVDEPPPPHPAAPAHRMAARSGPAERTAQMTDLRRRSVPDSLRYLAGKLRDFADPAYVAFTLDVLADEIEPRSEWADAIRGERSRVAAALERILIAHVIMPQESAEKIYDLLSELKGPR